MKSYVVNLQYSENRYVFFNFLLIDSSLVRNMFARSKKFLLFLQNQKIDPTKNKFE